MSNDLKLKYGAASSGLTVTNLHSLAASQSLIAGWSSASASNLSNLYRDYLYGGTFTSHASNRQPGQISIYVVGSLNDTPLWPAMSSGTMGTEGAVAFADIYRRDAIVRPLHTINVDNTASAIYTFPQMGIAWLFGGNVPTHHCLMVTHNIATTTAAGLAASGSAIYMTPSLDQVV